MIMGGRLALMNWDMILLRMRATPSSSNRTMDQTRQNLMLCTKNALVVASEEPSSIDMLIRQELWTLSPRLKPL